MKRPVTIFLLFALILLFSATTQRAETEASSEPTIVEVQHILIGFKRSVPGKKLERTKAAAKELAEKIVARARKGDDFDALVKEFTDDSYPGIYKLTNKGAPRAGGARTRDDMVPSFGDVAFGIEVGEVGFAEYHGGLCPYGWHVIKRLK